MSATSATVRCAKPLKFCNETLNCGGAFLDFTNKSTDLFVSAVDSFAQANAAFVGKIPNKVMTVASHTLGILTIIAIFRHLFVIVTDWTKNRWEATASLISLVGYKICSTLKYIQKIKLCDLGKAVRPIAIVGDLLLIISSLFDLVDCSKDIHHSKKIAKKKLSEMVRWTVLAQRPLQEQQTIFFEKLKSLPEVGSDGYKCSLDKRSICRKRYVCIMIDGATQADMKNYINARIERKKDLIHNEKVTQIKKGLSIAYSIALIALVTFSLIMPTPSLLAITLSVSLVNTFCSALDLNNFLMGIFWKGKTAAPRPYEPNLTKPSQV